MARSLLLILLFLMVFYMANRSNVRGIRNNNPLNIRKGNDWEGEAAVSRDHAFETFAHHKFGFRAGAKLLRVYQNRYGLYTLKAIIGRFAPPNENDTHNYAGFVAKQVGVKPTDRIDLSDDEKLAQVMLAMSVMEVGRHYSINDARQGVALA